MHGPARLLVVSHVVHYRHGGRLFSYAPYVLEMEIWARLFTRLTIAAPLRESAPPGDCPPFLAGNIEVYPMRETGGRGLGAKLLQLILAPGLALRLARQMTRHDAVHVRCPGNLGLLGALLAPLFARRMIAKYAGQWDGYPGEAWSCRLQRRLLGSRWWRGPALVYGEWPGAAPHITPFFNSAMTRAQMEPAALAALRPRGGDGPRRLLFVGRLSKAKGADLAIECCKLLRAQGCEAELDIIGEGPERQNLEAMAEQPALRGHVRLHGGLGFEEVLRFYETADVLLLPSETEGWPKALAEAMAFGVPCVAADRGLNPWMLGEGRGLTAPREAAAFAEAARRLLEEPREERERRRRACAAWGQRLSLEDVEEGLRAVMERAWGVRLAGGGA